MTPLDPNHAMLLGNVGGALVQVSERWRIPTDVRMLRDAGGNYTNQIRVTRPSGTYLITIMVEEESSNEQQQQLETTDGPKDSPDLGMDRN